MPITALTDPALLPNKTMDQQAFDNAMAYLIRNLPLRAQQENELAANLNSIAAGGAFAIPYIGWSDASTVNQGNGRLVIPGEQNQISTIYFSLFDTRNRQVSGIYDSLFYNNNNNAVKGYVTLTVINDTSRWVSYAITSIAYDSANFRYAFSVSFIAQGGSKLLANEAIIAQFQRNGDKGDLNSFPRMLVRDQVGSGASPQNLGAGWNTRRLATVVYNDIPGASLANSIITLPVGRYSFEGSASAGGTNGHVIALRNTSGGVFDVGENEYAGSNTFTRAFISSIFALSSQTQIRLDHYAAVAGSGGFGISNGVAEVYSHLQIIKIA